MSKHFGCKDCCKYQTDACDNPMYAETGKHLCPMYVMDIEYCYEKGRAEAIDEFVENLINPSNYERYDFDDCLTDSGKADDFFKYVFAMSEQLKEQKNETT